MAASASGSTYHPSISHANQFVATLKDYFGAREGLTVIVGRAAALPTVYTDFTAVDYGAFGNGQLGFVNRLNVTEGPTGSLYTFSDLVTSSGAVGDLAWIAFFESASPSGSAPVLAATGPFTVGP